MDYITVRELREKSGEIWQRIETGEEFVVTRNGKPFALLVHVEPTALEERLRLLRLTRLTNVIKRIQDGARESGADQLSDEEIQAEIEASRREHTRAAPAAPRSAETRYARSR